MKNLTIRVAEGRIWLSIGEGEEFMLAKRNCEFKLCNLKDLLETAGDVYDARGKCELVVGEVDEGDA